MPTYRYKALNPHGEIFDGQMEAASEAELVARLQDQGHLPMETQLADGGAIGDSSWRNLFRQRPLQGAALLQFTQQLATLLGAGQPLDRALSILLGLPEDERSRRAITDIRDVVRGGAPLSTALERQHGLFSRLYVNMVRAGEAGGSLLFLLGYVVPQFTQMYESLDVALPWFTNAVLQLGLFVRDWWVLLLVVPALVALFFERKARQPAFRLALDGWLLQRRGIGRLLGELETARLARTLGTLLRNGVPLLGALGIARNVLGNRALAADVEAAADEVKNGTGLSLALSRGKRFPRLALQMIQVGEESGALDTMLLKAADTFEQDSARRIDRLLAAMVPAITLVLASVVGAVIVAVLVPLYDLTNAIG